MWLPPAMLVAALAQASPAPDGVPLFAADEPLSLTLVADFGAIRADRSDDPEDRPALLILPGGDTLEVGLRPRGDFRRDPANCSFPPLRLDVKAKQAEGTVFEGQDELKIVVSCRPERDAFQQYVLVEYLLYRAYRLFTDDAFRVRLVTFTFADTEGGRDPLTRAGFFIEDESALARRMGGTVVDLPEGTGLRPSALNPRQATLVALFQYMIGNTDWSDQALHNVKLIEGRGPLVPVPYDFDFSGIVDAPYAVPDPLLGIRSVQERLYRGWCFQGVDRDAILAAFREKRPLVEALFLEMPSLDERRRRDAVAYLGGFFTDVDTPERAQRRVFRDCRPTG